MTGSDAAQAVEKRQKDPSLTAQPQVAEHESSRPDIKPASQLAEAAGEVNRGPEVGLHPDGEQGSGPDVASRKQ